MIKVRTSLLVAAVATLGANQPARAQAPPPEKGVSKAPANQTPEQLLARAKALFDDLEFEAAIPIARELLAREDATVDVRLDGYVILGSSLAIVSQPADAEKAFRLLLRGRPDFDMKGTEVAPKILRIFRNVKVEEDRIRAETRELERKRLIEELEITGEPIREAVGGSPIIFNYRLRDPRSAVNAVRVQYRKRGGGDFSALALRLDPSGAWSGTIPGEWTENENGFQLEYFVSTVDKNGEPLLEIGSPRTAAPMTIPVEPGTVGKPFYQSFWFWGVVTGVVAGSVVAGYFIYDAQTRLPTSDLGTLQLP